MRKKFLIAIAACMGALNSAGTVHAQELLSGDAGTACEAILCLSTGSPPGECTPSLKRYFSINASKPWKTIEERLNFLKLCPASGQTPEMRSLVEAISEAAGRCDAESLNISRREWGGREGDTYISDRMPEHCAAYVNHAYTDIDATAPRYVGDPMQGGYWVEAQNYSQAVDAYNERIKRERDRSDASGGHWQSSR
jgi:hypothetical protein